MHRAEDGDEVLFEHPTNRANRFFKVRVKDGVLEVVAYGAVEDRMTLSAKADNAGRYLIEMGGFDPRFTYQTPINEMEHLKLLRERFGPTPRLTVPRPAAADSVVVSAAEEAVAEPLVESERSRPEASREE